MMETFLDYTIAAFWKLCPTLAKRQDIAIRSFVKYHSLDLNPDSDQRNLNRYKEIYKKTKFPWDPPLER
jgi:hypothetical protein